MTKKEELQLMQFVKSKGGIHGEPYAFYRQNKQEFHNTEEEVEKVLDRYDQLNYFDERKALTPKFEEALQRLSHEVSKEDKEVENAKNHRKNEIKLTRWQVKTYWWIFIFALFGAIYGIYDIIQTQKQDSEYIKKGDLDDILKEYKRAENKKNNTIIPQHNDTTLINNK